MVVGGRTMKTLLFFHLNSLAIVLVLSQTKQPYFAPSPTVCKLSNAGREYAGPLNITRSGRTCQRWNSNKPHSNYYKESTLFPEGSAEAAGNKCRNPSSKYNEGVWCYTTDPDTKWEKCDVPFCDCKLTRGGHEYAGPVNITRSGRTCQQWTSDQPHNHSYRQSTRFPEGSAAAAGNKCRNPDSKYKEGVWCYTTSPDRRWEACDVKLCDCKLTNAGREYAGPLNITRSGLTCQRWNSDQSHEHRYRNSTLFPEGSAEAAGNKCRNPDGDYNEGVWCYTTSLDTRWEECDVKLCDLSGENESINIVKIVIPIVGVIVIICVVATIYAWKRAGLFQSSRNRFNTPNAERNQQAAVAMYSTPN